MSYPSSSSTLLSLSSSVMVRSCFKLVLSMAVAFALVYIAWHMHIMRYTRGDLHNHIDSDGNGRTGAIFKTSAVIGHDNKYASASSWTLTNERKGNVEDDDSVFPFPDEEEQEGEEESKNSGRIMTYFTAGTVSFSDVPIGPNNSIPTLPFLDACMATTQLFEKMHKAILEKIIQDIRGNIKKIQLNYDLQPRESGTLQEMVLRDLALGLADDELEGTSLLALTWLKRAFAFLSRFLSYIDAGEEQSESARKGYEETLRQFHGFALRTVFKAAFYTLSSRSAFLQELALNEADVDRPGFEDIAMADLRSYNSALEERLKILEDFFNEHGIAN